MNKKYIIISRKHSDEHGIIYWKADNAGYTYNPFQAGLYEEETILKYLDYYCNDSNLPVSVNDGEALKELGVFGNKLRGKVFERHVNQVFGQLTRLIAKK